MEMSVPQKYQSVNVDEGNGDCNGVGKWGENESASDARA